MAYKIALNGSNHVSEARVRAFEQSLAESVEKPTVERPQPVGRLQVSQAETVREWTPVRDRPQGGPPEATPIHCVTIPLRDAPRRALTRTAIC